MEEEAKASQTEGKDSTMYYIIGVLVLILVLGVGYALRPKPAKEEASAPAAEEAPPSVPIPTVARGPITEFACDTQYYNTVIGLPEYFLTVEGVNLPPAESVTCDFVVSQDDEELYTETVEAKVAEAPDLGGFTWTCTTTAAELPPNEPVAVDVDVVDDQDNTANCSAVYILPPP